MAFNDTYVESIQTKHVSNVGFTSTAKGVTNEAFALKNPHQVLSSQIPFIDVVGTYGPLVASGIAAEVAEEHIIKLTADPTVNNNKAWIAYETNCTVSGHSGRGAIRVDKWMRYAETQYKLRLYEDNGSAAAPDYTKEILPSEVNFNWEYDASAGIVYFDADPDVTKIIPLWGVFYTYIGGTVEEAIVTAANSSPDVSYLSFDCVYVDNYNWSYDSSGALTEIPTSLSVFVNGVKQRDDDPDYYTATINSGVINLEFGFKVKNDDWVNIEYLSSDGGGGGGSGASLPDSGTTANVLLVGDGAGGFDVSTYSLNLLGNTTLNGPASTTVAGPVELATDEETIEGVDIERAVTPSGLTSRLLSPGPIGEDNPGSSVFTSVRVVDEFSDVIGEGAFSNGYFTFRSSASGWDSLSWDMYYAFSDPPWYSAMAASAYQKRINFFSPLNPVEADFPAAICIYSPTTESGVPTLLIKTEEGDDLLSLSNTGDVLIAGITTTSGIKITGGSPAIGKVLTSDDEGNGLWTTPVGGSTNEIYQASHGFNTGDVLYLDGALYNKAIATDVATAEVVGVVSDVIDTDNFIILSGGHLDGLSGLTAGTIYFLSPTVSGALTSTEPTTDGYISKPILIADATDSGYFFNMRGVAVGGSSLDDMFGWNPGTQEITFKGHLVPVTSGTLNIGSPDKWIKELYVSASTIHVGDTATFDGTSLSITGGPNPINLGQTPTLQASSLILRPFVYNPGGGDVTSNPKLEFTNSIGAQYGISFNTASNEFSFDAPTGVSEGIIKAKKITAGTIETTGTEQIIFDQNFRTDGNVILGYDELNTVTIKGVVDLRTPITFSQTATLGDGNDTINVNSGAANNFTVISKNININSGGLLTTSGVNLSGDIAVAGNATLKGQAMTTQVYVDTVSGSLNTKIDGKEPVFSKNNAFNKSFGTASTEVCAGDDTRLSDARTPVSHDNTYHSSTYITTAGVTYETLSSNGDVGSTASTLCAGNDGRLSDARTPVSHNNTYHSETYVVTNDARLSDARTPVSHDNTYHSSTYITTAGVTYETLSSNGDVGSTASTLCAGNDSRLSDARTPVSHNHDDLYYTEGEVNTISGSLDTKISAKLNAAGGNITGNLTISGDLSVEGNNFIVNTQTVTAEDNLIIINSGETGAGVTAGVAGIEVERGSAINYLFYFDEGQDNFRVGISGSLQAVATREDTPTANGVATWNSSLYRFDTTTQGTAFNKSFGTGSSDVCVGNDSRLSDARTPVSHAANASTYGYGDTTNAGHLRVGTGLSATTGTVSVTYGTASSTACVGNDSRLSDARTPVSHDNTYHSSTYITTAGVTYETLSSNGDVGSTASTLCAGNDSRLSDARTPVSHNNTYHSETYVVTNDARLSDARTPVSHAANASTYGYGDTTNAGHLRVGTGLSATTGTVSVSYGTSSSTACVGNDSRLSDARTPVSHSNTYHSETYITSASVTYETLSSNGDIGSSASTLCAGNDSRLSDARTPVSHNNSYHSATYIVAADVNYTNLNNNSAVGAGSTQVARGDHSHAAYFPTTGGQLSGNLSVAGTTKTDGYFYAGATAPTNATQLNYDGYFYATRVYNAVYNDIADFQLLADVLTPGLCYYEHRDGAKICNTRCQLGVMGIASDTYGYGIGVRAAETSTVPIAVAGWVLAHVDKEYPSGTPLTNNELGSLTEMTIEEKMQYPERIIAIYARREDNLTWGPEDQKVAVNGRHWVKVK